MSTNTQVILAGTFTPTGTGNSMIAGLGGIFVPDSNYPSIVNFGAGNGILDVSPFRNLDIFINSGAPVGGTTPTLQVFLNQLDTILPVPNAYGLFAYAAVSGATFRQQGANAPFGAKANVSWVFAGTVNATSWPFYIAVIGKD